MDWRFLADSQGMSIGHIEIVVAEGDHFWGFDAVDVLDLIDHPLR